MRPKKPKEKQGSKGAHGHYPCQSPNITSCSAKGARGLTGHVRHKKEHRRVIFVPRPKWHARGERGPSMILQDQGKNCQLQKSWKQRRQDQPMENKRARNIGQKIRKERKGKPNLPTSQQIIQSSLARDTGDEAELTCKQRLARSQLAPKS